MVIRGTCFLSQILNWCSGRWFMLGLAVEGLFLRRSHLIFFGRWKPVHFFFLYESWYESWMKKEKEELSLNGHTRLIYIHLFIFYIAFVPHIRWSYAVDWYSGSWFAWASSVEGLFFRGSHLILFHRWKPIQFCCLVRKLIRKLNEKGRYKVQLVWSYAVDICTSILNLFYYKWK